MSDLFNCYNIGDVVSFVTWAGDLESKAIVLRGKVFEKDEKHVSVKTMGNHHAPALNDISYYIEDVFAVNHCGFEDNEKMRNYILSNWEKYDLTDTKEDFIYLLNVLESHDENIDSLHSAVFNGREWFCGYYGTFDTDREVVKVLLGDHSFYTDWEKLYADIYESACENECEDYEEATSMCIQVTHDGFVVNHQC